MLKKTRLVCLPTNKASCLHLVPKGELEEINGKLIPITSDRFLYTSPTKYGYLPHHLYGISDEKIKVGDWCLRINPDGSIVDGILFQATQVIVNTQSHLGYTKVIATSDKSLTIDTEIFGKDRYKQIPQFRDSFIKKWIEQYNKGNVIEWVNFEYEEYAIGNYGMSIDGEPDIDIRLKLRSDNTVITHPIKDSWTREELPIQILQDMLKYCESQQIYDKLGNHGDFYYKGKKWIEENL